MTVGGLELISAVGAASTPVPSSSEKFHGGDSQTDALSDRSEQQTRFTDFYMEIHWFIYESLIRRDGDQMKIIRMRMSNRIYCG